MIGPFCECGCGERTSYCKKRKRFNSFVNGHHHRSSEMKAALRDRNTERTGPKHRRWRGGKSHHKGYDLVRVAPNAYRMAARVVAETKLGRPLLRNERVWHLDGNRSNNAPENLDVVSIREALNRARVKRWS